MQTPQDLKYTAEHEWVRLIDGVARVGITDYAQDALGDIVYIDPPEIGRVVTLGESVAEVESTKSVSEIYAPMAGTIVTVNNALVESPELANSSPYGEGWLFELEPAAGTDFGALLDAPTYRALTEDES